MRKISKILLNVILILSLSFGVSYVFADWLSDTKSKIAEFKSDDSILPGNASTEKGNIGFIFKNIFDSSGKIKPDFLDLTGLGGMFQQSGSNIYYNGGNVGIGTTSPSAKLDVNGKFIRTVSYATGNGPVDGIDNGKIVSRKLSFNKSRANTKIRIGYTDNLRTYGSSGKSCRWEIRVDGASCPGQALVYDFYKSLNGENTHRSRTLVGYCSGIPSGNHEIQIWVGNTPGYSGSDCYTGWNNSTWVIEAEEVN